MKIGILTFHFAHNYGAVLQAFALQKYLIEKGHDVEIINHVPPSMKNGYKMTMWRECISLKHPFRSIYKLYVESHLYRLRKLRWKRFNSFINKNLILSNGQVVDSKYDAYIVGSDQVWNTKITKGFYGPYFCRFSFNKDNRLYISYAASMEANSLNEVQKRTYKEYLKSFDYISVRESAFVSLLQPLTTKQIYQTIDPTLLVNRDFWDKMTICPNVGKKYILLYRVWGNEARLITNKMSAEYSLDVIELVSWLDYKTHKNKYQAASPIDFISLFKYADFVVTDSFHGTAFSIIFNKNFYFVKTNDSQSRSESLLMSLGLQNRIINGKELLNYKLNNIDYTNVMNKLELLKKNSVNFLDLALGTDTY